MCYRNSAWDVLFHPEADIELSKVPARERVAIVNALDKLRVVGPALGYPHTSCVRGAHDLREVRPRQGRCAWRVFYRQIGHALVVGSIGPEANVDPKGFRRAIRSAAARLDEVEEGR